MGILIDISDIVALIRSFTSMFDQFSSCSVNREWNRMVARHSFLLRVVDFGDPVSFARIPSERIIRLAGSRLRRLKLCDFGGPARSHYNPNHPDYDIVKILQPMVVQNLQHIEILGHLHVTKMLDLISVLSQSPSPHVIQISSCNCFNWIPKDSEDLRGRLCFSLRVREGCPNSHPPRQVDESSPGEDFLCIVLLSLWSKGN